jgi:transcriptional regulator with XRE-family HTH domain
MLIESGTIRPPHSRAGTVETLGEWVRIARTREHLSQRALADRAGISRSYLCDIERSRGLQPSVSVLDKLAIALGASRSDLLKAAGVIEQAAGESGDAGERRIIALYRDLGAEGKIAVERFARFLRDEEHRFVQPALIEDELQSADQPFRQTGPTLFDLSPLETR